MLLHLIKDGKDKVIEIEDNNITKTVKNPHCEFLNKYVNEENYSLVIDDSDNNSLFAFINKTITKEDGRKISRTVCDLNYEKRISRFFCCNYLEDDYDSIEIFDRYQIDDTISTFCEEKMGNDSYYITSILTNYRNLNLKKCVCKNYDDRFPSNICRGGIIIGENKRVDMGLNKRTHAELFEEYFNRDSCEIDDKSKAIFAVISGPSVFIEMPKDPINSFQKEELKKLNEEIMEIKDLHIPIYLDVIKDEVLYHDLERFIGNEKRKSIH